MDHIEAKPVTPSVGDMPTITPTPEVVGPAGENEEAIDCVEVRGAEQQIAEGVVNESEAELQPRLPSFVGARRQRQRVLKPVAKSAGEVGGERQMTPEQKLLVLDTWSRSGLPAGDYAAIVGVSKHTLYLWKARFEAEGPGGLMPKARGATGSRLTDLTQRTVLMLKKSHPDWGVQRISDELARGPGLAASASAVSKVLHDAGYECKEEVTHPHPDKVREFERAAPNQLWQSDLFTFMMKRQNQRVHLVAFLDDHSRFIVSYGLHASQSAAVVVETFKAGIVSYGAPQEVLTDNGAQYVTWRGTSRFAEECQKRGVKHIVATPRRPQTLGKTERFWGTLWREMLEAAVFTTLDEARQRIGLFIDHYNFQRPHQGIGGLVPADRFFKAAPAVLETLKKRLAANALELSRHGVPKAPLYLAGNVNGQPLTLHGEGDRVVLQHNGQRTEIALNLPPVGSLPETVSASTPVAQVDSFWKGASEQAPGVSVLDDLGVPVSGTVEGVIS